MAYRSECVGVREREAERGRQRNVGKHTVLAFCVWSSLIGRGRIALRDWRVGRESGIRLLACRNSVGDRCYQVELAAKSGTVVGARKGDA